MIESTTQVTYGNVAKRPNFTLRSNEVGGQLTLNQYTGGLGFLGADQSPQLYWENAPADTQAFAVTMYDMDAPTGSGLWHWVVFNIPPDVDQLPSGVGNPGSNQLPQGAIQSNTDMGIPGYVGAAPPEGPAHRYLITVHALNATLPLDQDTTPALVGFHLHNTTLAKASLLVYGQKQ